MDDPVADIRPSAQQSHEPLVLLLALDSHRRGVDIHAAMLGNGDRTHHHEESYDDAAVIRNRRHALSHR